MEPAAPAKSLPSVAPLVPVDANAVLANLLEEPLVVVDVGCRWGFADVWTGLGDRCITIGFDPDAEECRRLRQKYKGLAQVRLEPVGLGAEPGLATLFMTVNPGGYSLLPPAALAVENHPGLEGGKLEATAVVEVTTLDAWCHENAVDRVDVIKLDTQGTELSILQGAAAALASVRAIEVEVQFNPLYEGTPLFGEVDRYLREHGFLLWRLKNLAHYGRQGARKDWHVPDAIYFDEDVATFPTGSGQLFWANAYYVRHEVAHPPADRSWTELVRDACITGCFSFHDLSGLLLDRAEQLAPSRAAEVIQVARSEALRAAKRELATAEQAEVIAAPVVIDAADARFGGMGWRPPEHFPFGAARWTGPGRDAFVDIDLVLVPGCRVEVLVVSAISPDVAATLAVEVNGTALELTRSPHELGQLYAGVVPEGYGYPRRFTRLAVRLDRTIPYNEVHTGSADDREMGVAVAWIRLNPA